jgi:hypothetical protein
VCEFGDVFSGKPAFSCGQWLCARFRIQDLDGGRKFGSEDQSEVALLTMSIFSRFDLLVLP